MDVWSVYIIQVFIQHPVPYSVSENWNFSHAFIKVPSLPTYLPMRKWQTVAYHATKLTL